MIRTAPDAARLLIVGRQEGTNVGASLQRAAARAGLATAFVDTGPAWAAPRVVRLVTWRLAGHRPPALRALSRLLVETCRRFQPHWVLTTGLAPVDVESLVALGRMGIRRLNYLTDDPWSPTVRSGWFFAALRQYDHVFSVRRANIQDLLEHGCAHVGYVPFGFDSDLFFPQTAAADDCASFADDVVFVGGADGDRVPYIAALIRAGFKVGLYGDYWRRYLQTRAHSRDHADLPTIRKATSAAKVALCLVRRSNRDGQVMRSYEAAVIGACMLVEDTPEHRELFGPDGETVVYFDTIDQMLARLRWLVDEPDERRRLGAAVRQHIVAGQHTYDDRLQTMLRFAARSQPQSSGLVVAARGDSLVK